MTSQQKPADPPSKSPAEGPGTTTCPRCGESRELAKIKGCIVCLACGFKMDCNGW
jgi:hypothetical protein